MKQCSLMFNSHIVKKFHSQQTHHQMRESEIVSCDIQQKHMLQLTLHWTGLRWREHYRNSKSHIRRLRLCFLQTQHCVLIGYNSTMEASLCHHNFTLSHFHWSSVCLCQDQSSRRVFPHFISSSSCVQQLTEWLLHRRLLDLLHLLLLWTESSFVLPFSSSSPSSQSLS